MSTVDYTQPPWGTFGRNIVLGVVSGGSNFITKGLNKFHVNGLQKFQEAVLQREEGTPLFTVSNHTSHIFQNGKTLPIERGQGIDQEIMKVAAQKASEGDWVHVFPEAKIGYTGKLQTLKWGIGKLICDAYREDQPPERQPLVLPFYHSGMGHVLPKGSIVPRYGNDIYVEVGDSVYLRDVLPRCKCKGKEQKAWEEITKRIALALTDLERKAVPNWDQKQNTEAQQRGIPPPIEAS